MSDKHTQRYQDGWACAEGEWLDGFDRDPDTIPDIPMSDGELEAWIEGYQSYWDHIDAADGSACSDGAQDASAKAGSGIASNTDGGAA